MGFCTNCGQQINDDVKFCANCGFPVNQTSKIINERKTAFDGEIHKCPSCGEVLKAFDIICPRCKYELRGTKSSNAIKDFYDKVNSTKIESEKIQLIKTFVVPNNKEDILEFFLLASSNFDAVYYSTHLSVEDVSDAWLAKIEQCYTKAEILLDSDRQFEKVKKIYTKIKNDIQKTIVEVEKEEKKEKVNSFFKNFFSFIIENFWTILIVLACLAVVGLIVSLVLKYWDEIYTFFSFNLGPIIGFILSILILIGIIRLIKKGFSWLSRAREVEEDTNKTGFASWNIFVKILWVILNIYTLGIPAIFYAICKKLN